MRHSGVAELTDLEKTQMTRVITDCAAGNDLAVASYKPKGVPGRCLAVKEVLNPVGFAYVVGHAVGQLGFTIDDNIGWDQLGRDFVVFWPDLPPAD